MEIINNDDRYTLFWRVFDRNDAVCWIGLQEGTVMPGDSDPYINSKGFKIEISHEKRGGPPVLTPGPIYSNNTRFIFQNNQLLIENYS